MEIRLVNPKPHSKNTTLKKTCRNLFSFYPEEHTNPTQQTKNKKLKNVAPHNKQHTTHNTQHTTHNTQHTTHNTQHTTNTTAGKCEHVEHKTLTH